MIITAESLVYYLLERGLITPESAVDGDLTVAESSSRNRNFKVLRKRQPGYFVKQVQQWEPQAISFLEREASCYWLAASDPAFATLAPLVPKYHLYDRGRHLLVVELLPEGENLSEYHRNRPGTFPVDVALLLGEALGNCHRGVRLPPKGSPTDAAFPKTVPWILSAHQLGNSPITAASGANQQVMSIIQKYTDFHRLLDALREQWQADSFVHGDMKWDNCITYRQNDRSYLKMIDWETADIGDAAWDVGAIFQAYLTFWVMSIPINPGTPPAQFFDLAPYPIEAMQPAIHAFWQSYVAARRLRTDPSARELLVRSVQLGAARMLQTAYEHMYYWPQITGNALCLLQVSLNILSNPQEAVSDLLSL